MRPHPMSGSRGIIINGHFYSAANYPCMGSLSALYNGINTYNMALMIISKNQSLKYKGRKRGEAGFKTHTYIKYQYNTLLSEIYILLNTSY